MSSINSQFLYAAAQGDLILMQDCLMRTDRACAEAVDEDGKILKAISPENHRSKKKSTALHLACITNQERGGRLLIF